MKTLDVRPQPYVKQLRCDRCERVAEADEVEFQEFTSIDHTAGYGSIFGDGMRVQIDLCQHCLKQALGQWLKVTETGIDAARLVRQLESFDATQHGGEFPP